MSRFYKFLVGFKVLPFQPHVTGFLLAYRYKLTRSSSEADPTGAKPKCPMDPYVVTHHKSTFIDQQMLKLQEPLGMVPVGELPRHLTLSADR